MKYIGDFKILINNVKKIFFFRKRNNELSITKNIFLPYNYFSYLFAILYNFHFILFLTKFFIEIHLNIQIYYELLISIQ